MKIDPRIACRYSGDVTPGTVVRHSTTGRIYLIARNHEGLTYMYRLTKKLKLDKRMMVLRCFFFDYLDTETSWEVVSDNGPKIFDYLELINKGIKI